MQDIHASVPYRVSPRPLLCSLWVSSDGLFVSFRLMFLFTTTKHKVQVPQGEHDAGLIDPIVIVIAGHALYVYCRLYRSHVLSLLAPSVCAHVILLRR